MSLLLSLARADPPAPPAVTAFARKTGDLAVLSSADIRVLALCLTLELEENGTWRVREYPGQALTGPPKEEKKDEGEEKKDGEGEEKGDDKGEEQEQEGATKEDEADKLVDKVEALKVDEASKKEEEQSAAPADPHASESAASSPSPVPAPAASAPTPADTTPAAPAAPAANDDEGDVSDAESDSSAGSWITPDNVHDHQVRDLGLFESAEASASASGSAQASTSKAAAPPKPKTIMKAAVLTGDFAMQNVALQMGLNVLGSGGKRVREVRTWVLRCHACFKCASQFLSDYPLEVVRD